jgi:hypothetical protein
MVPMVPYGIAGIDDDLSQPGAIPARMSFLARSLSLTFNLRSWAEAS